MPPTSSVEVVLQRLLHVAQNPWLFSSFLVAKCKSALLRMLAIFALRWEVTDKTALVRGHISLGVLRGPKTCRRIPGAFKRAVSTAVEEADGVQSCVGLLRGIHAGRSSKPTPSKRLRGKAREKNKKRSASSQPTGKDAKTTRVSDRSARDFAYHEMYNYFLEIRIRFS